MEQSSNEWLAIFATFLLVLLWPRNPRDDGSSRWTFILQSIPISLGLLLVGSLMLGTISRAAFQMPPWDAHVIYISHIAMVLLFLWSWALLERFLKAGINPMVAGILLGIFMATAYFGLDGLYGHTLLLTMKMSIALMGLGILL